MNPWHQCILGLFTANLSRLWVACDPDGVLLDEKLLAELRARGFDVMGYDDPFAFRAEFEERYRAAWDIEDVEPASSRPEQENVEPASSRPEQENMADWKSAPQKSAPQRQAPQRQYPQKQYPQLIVHLRRDDANDLPWDILRHARPVRLILAELFPRLAYSAVRQMEPEQLAVLYEAHQTELQSVRGEGESRDFILEHVYQLMPRSIRTQVDFWREVLRLHFANRALPEPFAVHVANILHGKRLFLGQPVAEWLSSKSALLRVLQDAWHHYLQKLKMEGRRLAEPQSSFDVSKIEIPFDHTDVRAIIDSMFLDGNLHPVAVTGVPVSTPGWIKAGIVEDVWSRYTLAEKTIKALVVPEADSSHKQWGDFARHFGEMMNRVHNLPTQDTGEWMTTIRQGIKAIQTLSDERLQAWVAARHYADLILQPTTKGPVMVHHIPRYLRQRRSAGESRIALLVFDGLAFDQWVQIREHLIARETFAFDENTTFAWLPSMTSVSRQALFSGLKPREFEDSIGHTGKEETLWKAFWQNEGLASSEVMYQRSLHHIEQLDSLETEIIDRTPQVLGLVIDEVDARLHKERCKEDVALWIKRWLHTGLVERLFTFLLGEGFSVYVTSDHGNVDAEGIGKPDQGVISETRGQRVRVYRSEPLRLGSAATYPHTVSLDIDGLPANFKPLFSAGRHAFVSAGERVVVHGGVSVEELIVPFVKVVKVVKDE